MKITIISRPEKSLKSQIKVIMKSRLQCVNFKWHYSQCTANLASLCRPSRSAPTATTSTGDSSQTDPFWEYLAWLAAVARTPASPIPTHYTGLPSYPALPTSSSSSTSEPYRRAPISSLPPYLTLLARHCPQLSPSPLYRSKKRGFFFFEKNEKS